MHPPRACDALSSAHARLPPLILHVEGWRSRPQKSSPVFHSLNEALLLSSITVTTYVCEERSFHASLSPPLDCKLHGGEDSVLALDFQSQQAQGCVRLRQVGCHDTAPETRGLSNRNRILPVLEAASPRPGCNHGQFLVRTHLLAGRQSPSSVSTYDLSSVHAHGERTSFKFLCNSHHL